jgi:cytochrome P450
MALASHPDQWQAVLDDPGLVEQAGEEILRWATPVLHMRRTATENTVLADTEIAAGDKVVMWYASGNRDEAVFDQPFAFDVTRTDNPHQAFGGGGPHLCLGAFLARLEITVLLEEMVRRGIRLEQTGEAVRVPSNFVNGVAELPMAVVA